MRMIVYLCFRITIIYTKAIHHEKYPIFFLNKLDFYSVLLKIINNNLL